MKILLIVAHPNPSSFNHALAETARRALQQKHYRVMYHDLYAESFPPLLDTNEIPRDAILPAIIDQHCREIRDADGILIVHPNWWGMPPAILKGWVDRVIRPGVAYRFVEGDQGEGVPEGLLKAHNAVVFNTTNTHPERESCVFGDPLETLWKNCIFGLCGVQNFFRKSFGVIVTSSPEQREQWLEEAREIVNNHFM